VKACDQVPRGVKLKSNVLLNGIRTRQQLKAYRSKPPEVGRSSAGSLRWFESCRKREEDILLRRLAESRNSRSMRYKSRVSKCKGLSNRPAGLLPDSGVIKVKKPKTPHYGVRVLRYTTNPALIKASKPLILSSDWDRVANNLDGVKNKLVGLFWTHLEKKLLPGVIAKREGLKDSNSLNLLDGTAGKSDIPSHSLLQKSTRPPNCIDSLRLAPVETLFGQMEKVGAIRNRPPRCGLLKVSALAKAVSETVELIRAAKFTLKKL